MSTPTEPAEVERAFMETGNGWILNMAGRGAILKQVAREIDEFIIEYKRRFGNPPDPFALLDENPVKAAGFFELYTNPPISMDMRVAVWQLIHGADIHSVQFAYDRDRGTELVIKLTSGRRRTLEEYRGDSLADFVVIKHIGVLTLNGREVLDGYYPSILPE